MSVFTMADATFYIGTKTGNDALSGLDINDFENDSYTEVGEASAIAGLADVQNFAGFTGLKDGRTRQLKTTRAAETVTLTCGFDPDDSGQDALRTAGQDKSSRNYNFKVVYNDGDAEASPPIAPTTIYWAGLVGNDPYPGGGAEDVSTIDFSITNNTGFFVEFRE